MGGEGWEEKDGRIKTPNGHVAVIALRIG